jgi:ABC-type transporter Mla MlaB component
MAEKSDRLGLLSKMALFVRNPTKDWSDLDRPEPSAEAGYDKQALKAMIERKRQNDFVRRREFDQLRKLRSREASGMGGLARPSVFQTSMATDPDGRAVTLKKIDEIEAQMSKQWWKGKQESANAHAAGSAGSPQQPSGESGAVDTEHPGAPTHGSFDTTQNAEYSGNGAEFTVTEMGVGAALAAAPPSVGGLSGRYDGRDVAFSTSELFAIDADDMATDPELEEAAIRFANGDDTGAESGLLDALRGEAILPDVAASWAAALLDFYRATDSRAKFDQAVLEFGYRFDRVVPQWESIANSRGTAGAGTSVANAGDGPADAAMFPHSLWECPSDLTVHAMEGLRDVMSSHPMPWHLGWGRLASISSDAMPLLGGLFSSLCDEPVALCFSGGTRLVQTLRAMMPSGDRGVSPAWWAVRLDVLRTMQLQDEFELAALDYCVTYEVSPPAWTPARCQFETVNAAQGAAQSLAATVPMGLDQAPAGVLELRGDVLGDATQALAGGGGFKSGELISVSCHGLVRVDFSAAGSILNWVALRQSEGCHVQFQGVHRLVAAFFNVIGINEHARVVPRAI